jgi:hypothetical protein
VPYILLFPASSGSRDRLEDECKFEQELARARGKSSVVGVTRHESGKATEELVSHQGIVELHSGFMMDFVEEEETELPIMDVAKKAKRTSYAVPTEALDSLPLHVLGKAEKQEYVRIQAEYDPDTKEFSDVSLGWDPDQKSPWDRLMEEIDERETVTPVLDHLVNKHGDDSWTPEAIADVRGVETQTVRENIKQIQASEEDEEE